MLGTELQGSGMRLEKDKAYPFPTRSYLAHAFRPPEMANVLAEIIQYKIQFTGIYNKG